MKTFNQTKTMNTYKSVMAALALACFSTLDLPVSTAQAAPGDLDTTFAGTGESRIGFGGGLAYCQAAAVQSDGKLLMGGYTLDNTGDYKFALVRFDTNNVLDTSFGDNGRVRTRVSTLSFPIHDEGIFAMRIQADGKIVAAGDAQDSSNLTFAVVRYSPDGSLDTSFGTGGKVLTDFGSQTQISAMAIQPDGKILVAGGFGPGFQLARYETNGALDATFGNGGTVVTPLNGEASALLLQSDGNIVVAGDRLNSDYTSDFAVLRYTTNGMLDTTFGGTGEVFTHITGSDHATAVALQLGYLENPAKIVVAGLVDYPLDFAIVRYNLNGSLDTSFGSGGITTNTFGPQYNLVQALAVQGSLNQPRKITVAGFNGGADLTGTNIFALARFNADGSPDSTFGAGGSGKTTLAIRPGSDDEAHAMTFQAGKIVLAGYSGSGLNSILAAARFNSDGSLDNTFGQNGVVTADITDLSSQAQAVAIQPDGKIIVVGSATNGVENMFAIARYNPDGVLDENFGSNGGKTTTLVGFSNAVANAVALQSDGKIVTAGDAFNGLVTDFAVVRYNPDGSADTSFGDTGQVTTPVGSGNSFAKSVAVQTDGKIVVAGYGYNGANDDFAVVRYTTNGVLDASLGGSGKVTTPISTGEDQAWAVRIQSDGKIVLAGQGQVGTATDFALVRYNPDGSLDNSFGSFGRVATDFGGGSAAVALALAIQPDGRLIAAGVVANNGEDSVALARYTTNGLLDASFGAGGEVMTQVGLAYDYAASLELEQDGRIVVAGASQQGANYQYAILRYNPDGSLDHAYGFGGKVVVSFGDGGDDLGNAVALDQIGRAVVVGNANNLFGVTRLASEPFLKFTSINYLTNGQAALQGLGVPDTNNTLDASSNLGAAAFSPLDSVTPDAGGFWQYLDTNTAGVSSRFYRLSYP